jgi:small-conductance mechanosensitive channel
MGYIADTYNIGDRVSVEVWPSDVFNEDFDGIVVDISENVLTVRDQDGDVWDVEYEQVCKID